MEKMLLWTRIDSDGMAEEEEEEEAMQRKMKDARRRRKNLEGLIEDDEIEIEKMNQLVKLT